MLEEEKSGKNLWIILFKYTFFVLTTRALVFDQQKKKRIMIKWMNPYDFHVFLLKKFAFCTVENFNLSIFPLCESIIFQVDLYLHWKRNFFHYYFSPFCEVLFNRTELKAFWDINCQRKNDEGFGFKKQVQSKFTRRFFTFLVKTGFQIWRTLNKHLF